MVASCVLKLACMIWCPFKRHLQLSSLELSHRCLRSPDALHHLLADHSCSALRVERPINRQWRKNLRNDRPDRYSASESGANITLNVRIQHQPNIGFQRSESISIMGDGSHIATTVLGTATTALQHSALSVSMRDGCRQMGSYVATVPGTATTALQYSGLSMSMRDRRVAAGGGRLLAAGRSNHSIQLYGPPMGALYKEGLGRCRDCG